MTNQTPEPQYQPSTTTPQPPVQGYPPQPQYPGQNPIPPNPGYQWGQPQVTPQGYVEQRQVPYSDKTNTLSVVAFIFSFLIPLVGLILSIIAKNQIKQTGENGQGWATAAFWISIVLMILYFIAYIATAGGLLWYTNNFSQI